MWYMCRLSEARAGEKAHGFCHGTKIDDGAWGIFGARDRESLRCVSYAPPRIQHSRCGGHAGINHSVLGAAAAAAVAAAGGFQLLVS